jgi:hypothetical protein
MDATLPVEGWVQRWASYGFIVRAVVAEIRDHGPLDASHVLVTIKSAGLGADVGKAAHPFDYNSGAERILNLLTIDVDVIQHAVQTDGVIYSVNPDVCSAHSKALDRFIDVPPADTLAAQREHNVRFQQLRRWIAERPFQNVWRDGIRQHSDEAVADMAAQIELVGYYGPHIVVDQHGMIINGHLRAAALEKLGQDPTEFTQEIFFPDDTYRLAWIINSHYSEGRWPADLKKEITRFINHAMARSGIKVEWPADIPLITGFFNEVPALGVGQREEEAAPIEGSRGIYPLPRKASKTALGMMLLLERGGEMSKTALLNAIGNDGSCFYRGKRSGFMVDHDGLYSLTPAGTEQAKAVWLRDRPGRNVPA